MLNSLPTSSAPSGPLPKLGFDGFIIHGFPFGSAPSAVIWVLLSGVWVQPAGSQNADAPTIWVEDKDHVLLKTILGLSITHIDDPGVVATLRAEQAKL